MLRWLWTRDLPVEGVSMRVNLLAAVSFQVASLTSPALHADSAWASTRYGDVRVPNAE